MYRRAFTLVELPAVSRRKRAAFTLVELLVTVGIISILIGVLLPALARARASARAVACQNNLRQLITAVIVYANDSKGSLPFPNSEPLETPPGVNGISWRGPGWLYDAPKRTAENDMKAGVLWPYLKKVDVYRCPDDVEPFKTQCTH